MLSELEIGQFHAFGYTVLRNCLSVDEFEAVEKAYTRLIPSAPRHNRFSDIGTRRTTDFVYEDVTLGNLIEHPKVMEAMRDIYGTECLYNGGQDMWENKDFTPWHCDGPPARDTVTLKVALYLDEQDKDSGSLNVIPGSHHPEFSSTLFQSCGYWENGNHPRLQLDPDRIPGATSLHTQPRDIVLWNNHIWHSAFKRKDGLSRRTLFLGYTPDPGNNLLEILTLREQVKFHLKVYEHPYLYSKEMMKNGGPLRNKMVARLEELEVENVRENQKAR